MKTTPSDPVWNKIIIYLLLGLLIFSVPFLLYFLYCPQDCVPCSGLCAIVYNNPPWVILGGLASLPILILTWYWRTIHKEADIRNAEESLINDRFCRAVQLLGDKNESVRIGGLFALERLAIDSPRDLLAILEILAAYIRGFAKRPSVQEEEIEDEHEFMQEQMGYNPREYEHKPTNDVLAALKILGRRYIQKDIDAHRPDLRETRLAYIDISNTKGFSNALFAKADLNHVFAIDATLENTVFDNTNIYKGVFTRTNMKGATLWGAVLSNARLDAVDLSGAVLVSTRMKEAMVARCTINGAQASEADFTMARVYDCNVADSIFTRCRFYDSTLMNINFKSCNLEEADFRKATIHNVDFSTSRIQKIRFKGAQFTGENKFPDGFNVIEYMESEPEDEENVVNTF